MKKLVLTTIIIAIYAMYYNCAHKGLSWYTGTVNNHYASIEAVME